jgi:RimJ/RimL family protein N-acetyltransferase/uncharacterized protein (DUF952 family)
MTVKLLPVQVQDAEKLFPLIYQTDVVDWLLWDGPSSLDEYSKGLTQMAAEVARGEKHLFTMWVNNQPVGNIDIRPRNDFRADIGLWIGTPYQGRGIGSQAVQQITAYGFFYLGLEKIEADVFVGNHASRRIFEKCGFILEGTRRLSERKRDRLMDEWKLGITRQDYMRQPILHLCRRAEWEDAQLEGEYRAPSLALRGFIHFSRPDQIDQVARNFYQNVPDRVLLWVKPDRLKADLRYELSDYEADFGQYFPHLYGPLNLDAVENVVSYL